MSTRTNIRPAKVMDAVSMAADQTSLVTVLQSVSKFSYSFSWSGSSPVGVINVQVSDDYSVLPNGTVNNAGTWTTITLQYNGTLVTDLPVSGNTGTGFVDIITSAYAVRAKYIHSTGTGSLTAYINGKVS